MIVEYMLAIASEWVSGWLGIAGDDFGTNETGDPDSDGTGRMRPYIGPLGLIARPKDPDTDPNGRPTKGAGLLTFGDGGDAFSMPTSDPRAIAKVPPVKKGGTAVYSSPGGCLVFDGDNGALIILVPNGDASKNHAISIDPKAGSMSLNHADGMGVSLTSGGLNSVVIRNKAGDAYIEVNDQGIVNNGNTTFNGGMVMGNVASAQPVPLDPLVQGNLDRIALAIGQIATLLNAAPGPVLSAPGSVTPFVPTPTATTKLSASP